MILNTKTQNVNVKVQNESLKFSFNSPVDIHAYIPAEAVEYKYNYKTKRGSFLVLIEEPIKDIPEISSLAKTIDQNIVAETIRFAALDLPKEITVISDHNRDKVYINGEGHSSYIFPVNLDGKIIFLDNDRKRIIVNILPDTEITLANGQLSVS